MAKKAQLREFQCVPRAAKARPMAHGIGGRIYDSYLSAIFEIRTELLMGIKILGRQLTTQWAEIGV